MHSYFLTITRSIRTNISKLFSIVVIMLLGIAFVSGLGTISPMIQTSFGNELRRENAPDLILKSSSDTGFQDEDGDGILDIVDDLLQSRIATSAEGLTMLDSSMFESMDDEYMRGRAADIKDVSFRLLCNLTGKEIPNPDAGI